MLKEEGSMIKSVHLSHKKIVCFTRPFYGEMVFRNPASLESFGGKRIFQIVSAGLCDVA